METKVQLMTTFALYDII